MEVGVGIHGEPGRRREKLAPAAEIVERDGRRRSSPTSRPRAGANVLAFVNGMGGTPLIELYLVYSELDAGARASAGSTGARNSSATTSPSLEMAGVSITLLELDDELTALWDAPVHTAGAALGRVSAMNEQRP